MVQTIEREVWSEYFRTFTHDKHGWLVTVVQHDTDSGILNDATDLPLEGISVGTKGGRDLLTLIVRRDSMPHGHLVHTVEDIVGIRVKTFEQNGNLELHVRSHVGRSIFHFRRAAIPKPDSDPVSGRR